jgi:TolA-binding protein
MRNRSTPLDAAVRAFREETAVAAAGSATRARVLSTVHRGAGRAARRLGAPQAGLLAVAALAIAVSASASVWTAIDRRFRAPAPEVLSLAQAVPARTVPPAFARRSGASTVPSPAVHSGDTAESQAYAFAHRAHFADGEPARALRAWNAYLDQFPHGTLAPEARFNRALCLVRLGRRAAAAAALRPLAAGGAGGYRQREASVLLDWMGAPSRPRGASGAAPR